MVFKKNYVCISLIIIIIVVSLLYILNILKSIPCSNDVLSKFYSNFIHTDMYHLFSNAYFLYTLFIVENRLGSKKFFALVFFILITSSLIEVILNSIYKLPCSIGISGLLFGLLTWNMLTQYNINRNILISIFLSVIGPSFINKKVSLSGHIIGCISGFLSVFIYNYIYT